MKELMGKKRRKKQSPQRKTENKNILQAEKKL